MGDRRRNRGGRKLLIVVALGPFCAAAADLPVREVTSQATRVGNAAVPGFQRGYMYWLEGAAVRLYTPEGYPAFVRVLSVPRGATPSLDNVALDGLAVDTDGSVAVAVSYAAGHAGGILFLDRNGLDTGFLDTGVFLPSNLAYAEDHSLWSFGSQLDDRQDYPMVRRYSADRKETGRYLPRSLFPKGLPPGMARWQEQQIMLSHDKVGLIAYSGNVGTSHEWVELDLNGNLLRRVPVKTADVTQFAFTSDSHLYWKKSQNSDTLLLLNKTTPDWQEVGPSPGHHLLGPDGEQLVYSSGRVGPVDLQWFAQPASKGP